CSKVALPTALDTDYLKPKKFKKRTIHSSAYKIDIAGSSTADMAHNKSLNLLSPVDHGAPAAVLSTPTETDMPPISKGSNPCQPSRSRTAPSMPTETLTDIDSKTI
ncbi:Hypothetical predicted protein, partial [Pelobates cultripes]